MNDTLRLLRFKTSDLAEGTQPIPDSVRSAAVSQTSIAMVQPESGLREFSAEEGLADPAGVRFEGTDNTDRQDASTTTHEITPVSKGLSAPANQIRASRQR